MQEPPDLDFERWAREHNQGNRFRRATIKTVLPTEAKTMTVEDALKVGKIGAINVRKLLTDNRDKFQK